MGYDAAWVAYRAFGLAEPYAPSLYHDYYLCLGTQCTGALDPSPRPDGIGNTVDAYRNLPDACESFAGFSCQEGHYCSTSGGSEMDDYAHAGGESLQACEELCAQDAS